MTPLTIVLIAIFAAVLAAGFYLGSFYEKECAWGWHWCDGIMRCGIGRLRWTELWVQDWGSYRHTGERRLSCKLPSK